ncbi:hypothetical protein KC19_6G060100 [Ceratodon purpureus]|uniref:Uncharacterized protein n=1 Tax=Ceratodon purpureus TaxID=3225 RepID=A0A8T0HFI2_CERPU|nr:hypothetical protein KC19_6G060100 [Ceratodon purpureus]
MRKHSGTGRVVVVSGTFDHNCPRSQAPIFVTVWLILLHVVRPVSLHIAMVGKCDVRRLCEGRTTLTKRR